MKILPEMYLWTSHHWILTAVTIRIWILEFFGRNFCHCWIWEIWQIFLITLKLSTNWY